jgi:hypothetical protein
MGRNVLVVSTVEHADDVLRAHVGDADTIKVVVPVVRQGVLDWLANDQKAFDHAERVAERTAEQKRSIMRSGSPNARPSSSLARPLMLLPARRTSG